MLLIIEHSFLLACLLFVILVVTITLSVNYKKYRMVEPNKLLLLSKEIQVEKKIAQNLSETPSKIDLLSYNTQQKLQRIKVGILYIDLTLSEIF